MFRTSLLPLRPRNCSILCAPFSSSISKSYALPNLSLDLDPSYQRLFNDIDISLKKSRLQQNATHRELEIVPGDSTALANDLPVKDWTPLDMEDQPFLQEDSDEREHRKSPAASFGSRQIGTVVLPQELQTVINLLISDGKKSLLHSDATRLFTSPGTGGENEIDWDTQYDSSYRSRTQAARHYARDGAAFASVALPAHYSAITAVLHHLKLRLGSALEVNNIIDWGAGTGSGLWASLYAFQNNSSDDGDNKIANNSTIKSYLGIDKREGLVSIGKKLVSSTSTGGLNVRWKKAFKEEDKILQDDASKTIALSSFMMTTLPTSMAQKTMIQEMWDSGAHTMVILDHNSKEGFEAVARAREYLLRLGRQEIEDPNLASLNVRGSHVVAPCPHDQACPLLHSGGAKLVCGFSQRIQRPSFVRLTKHSGIGHEDIGYSYVVVQRGTRPKAVTNVGRVGAIGKKELEKELLSNTPMKELQVGVDETIPLLDTSVETLSIPPTIDYEGRDLSPAQVEEQLRREAYGWPRLVFSPLKKSGHIILDSCTAEGKIVRLTIPKSQGKQAFYDARKSSWGDIFPHSPKNAPLERHQPRLKRKDSVGTGADIGKRKEYRSRVDGPSYAKVAESIRETKKKSKRDYALSRGDKVWDD
ncbi:hypothetical protein M413DRAFT_416605 [Hebeloma cylindrosporum]|uniref:Rsm22-domain-containing protein n=1 Tax=Hebeloma cylindrosporum TaxID=76867 RepID=A0A0C3CFT1_HEBCY|nr:hypothetical protein M413DRAFT_416605 [Hebeloma cylindrosporum h7]